MGQKRRPSRRSAGFTLIEAALTTVIVGTGVLAIVSAQQTFHIKNQWAQRSATGMLLAQELRELLVTLPAHDPVSGTLYVGPEPGETGADDSATLLLLDDVDDFAGESDAVTGLRDGLTFSPPVNALRQPISDLTGWSQTIQVINVLPDNVSVDDALAQPLGTTPVMRVTVTVSYQGPNDAEPATIADLSWLVTE